MDIKMVKRLLKLMEEAGLTELDVEAEGVKVRLKKGGSSEPTVIVAPTAGPIAPAAGAGGVEARGAAAESSNRYIVRAPMVGTFYRAPSPQSPPFVNVGDLVKEGQTVCLIEAMKLMNELKSERAGKVVRISTENGVAVEFNQPLIEIEPSAGAASS